MELECFHDGTLAKILKGDGSEVAVGEVIAQISDTGEAAKPKAEATKPKEEKKLVAVTPPEKPKKPAAAPVMEDTVPPKKVEKPAKAAPGGPASPYAKKRAAELGVDLATVSGTGPGGRIVAKDVENAPKGGARAAVKTEAKAEPKAPVKAALAPAPEKPAPRPQPDEELPPISVTSEEATVEEAPFRARTLAMRVTASKHVIPHFYVTRSVDVTELMKRRDALKKDFGATLTHVVALAVIKALAAHPEVNRSYDRGRIIRWKNVNLGFAVDTEEGLTVAVLRAAQGLGLKELAERTNALVARARDGKLSGDERAHATFTISNLGMFGVEQFAAIINPPSAVTLSVAAALDVPVVRDSRVEAGKVMKLTVSCDHRVLDGVAAAKFLADLCKGMEPPGVMVGV